MPDIKWRPISYPERFDKFISILETEGWQQHVEHPTRYNSVLDLVFTNGTTPTKLQVGTQLPGSDHKVVYGYFNITSTKVAQKSGTVLTRNYKYAKWDELQSFLRCLDWSPYFTNSSAKELCDLFYEYIGTAQDYVAPPLRREIKKNRADYIPKKVRIRMRNHVREYYKSNDFSSLVTLKDTYDTFKAERVIEAVKQERIQCSKTSNTEALVRLMKTRISSSRNSTPSLIMDNGILYDNPLQISELFGYQFASCFTQEDEIKVIGAPSTPTHSISTVLFSKQNISLAIASLRTSYSAGPDGIPTILLKRGGEDIPLILLKLFNTSLSSGNYPENWKLSYICPKHKCGPTSNIENYRPINITSVVSRTMEKVIVKAVVDYMTTNQLLSPAQHGFLKGRSCTTSYLDYLDNVTSKRDQGLFVTTLFLDFKQAFDKVPHKRLVTKLQSYGFRDPLLSWLRTSLEGRFQVVKFSNCYSTPRLIQSGVVQGSVLGPILFLIYVNDICSVIRNGIPYLFADDLKIVYSFSPAALTQGFSQIQEDLKRIFIWSETWQLPLNPNKSGILHFNKSHPEVTLHLGDIALQVYNTVKDLGITYSRSLTFTEYADSVVSKGRRLIGLLHRNILIPEAKLILYKAMVRPILEYCTVIYGSMNVSDRIRVENIQRNFTRRLLIHNEGLPYEARCKKLGLESLWLRRLKLNLTLLFRLLFTNPKTKCAVTFKTTQAYNLRNSENIIPINKYRSKLRCRFFITQYSMLWNKLPAPIRACRSLGQFQRLLSKFLLSNESHQFVDGQTTNGNAMH
ncbi:unnamed protein product [Heterobilharzia americana]|nr:unnamed protein product [Heterobilharzia americana]